MFRLFLHLDKLHLAIWKLLSLCSIALSLLKELLIELLWHRLQL